MDLDVWIQKHIAGDHSKIDLSPDQQDLHGLSLQEAIDAHEAWCEKLELTLRGKNPEEYDPQIIGSEQNCKLGKWIYNEGKDLAQHIEYKALMDAHRRFHRCAGGILESHRKGHFAEAIKSLRHDLVDLSKEVQLELVRLLKAKTELE